jgi:hypothetical protein
VAEVYVYGVAPSDRCWRPQGVAGVHAATVRVLDDDGLAALVSDVEEEVLGRRRELKAHTAVLEQALERSAILPARFGTMAQDDAAVIDGLLRARRDALQDLLDQIEGLVEVRLSGSYDEAAVLAEVIRRRPEVGERAGGSTQERMERGRRVVAALDDQRREDSDALLAALSSLARDVRVEPVRGELDVVAIAFLLHRDDVASFDDAVSEATRPLADRMKLRYVGPLPPVSFVSLDVGAPWDS